MKTTYLFYDIESTGLNPCFDQVLQFAAIRTDTELNEIDRHEIRIKLNSDIIPAPMAILTHLQSIDSMQEGVNEVEGIQYIHTLMNTPGTISLGYNTLGFDDEFLRFSFYRNLLTPYTHQFSNECGRMDLFPIIILYYLFKPDTLQWPTINGKVSLKLDNLNATNALAKGMAHDAMVDVEATVALAKICYRDRVMWTYCTGYFNKKIDSERLSQLHYRITINHKQHPLAYVCHSRLGIKNNFLTPVIALGSHKVYKNQTLWLRLDQSNLTKCTSSDIFEHTFVIKRKAAENILILSYLDRYHHLIDIDRQDTVKRNLQWISDNAIVFREIITLHQNYTYPTVDGIDADSALYQMPFTTPSQQQWMREFHDSKIEIKKIIVKKCSCPILQELAMRIIAKHWPQSLSTDELEVFFEHQSRIYHNTGPCIDYKNNNKLNATTALEDISQLQQTHSQDHQKVKLLNELSRHIKSKQKT